MTEQIAPDRAGGVESIAVVVPARDEADRLPECLDALQVAAQRVRVPVSVTVVADCCHDGTAGVAASFPSVRVVTSKVGRVGAARRVGFESVFGSVDADIARNTAAGTLWLATTDADSAVCPQWFERQLAHVANGADVVVGTVDVTDWSPYPPAVALEYERRYDHRDGHQHIHGANMSMRASAYLDVGGFSTLASHEDVELVNRLSQAGWRIQRAGDLPVTTSARPQGRAPDGFARFLRDLA